MVEVSTEVAVTETPEFHVGDPMLPSAGFPFTPVLPALPHTINIDIRLLGGRLIANFDVSLDDTVREIKQQISQRGWLRGFNRTQLVCGCQVLYDNDRVRDCEIEARRLLTLIHHGHHSALAELVDEEGGVGEAGSLIDLVDSVFQSQHEKTTQYQPEAARVAANFPEATRNQVLQWLGVACDALLIEPALMHAAALTLDRYSVASRNPVPEGTLFRLCLAALCTEMKLATNQFPHGYWQRILVHLGQGRESLQAILRTEMQILSRLNFVVNVPTPMTFLASLGLRFQRELYVLGVATFLIELALFNVTLQYTYPASVLAAGAIGASLFAHPRGPEQTEHMHGQLFEDILGFSTDSHHTMRATLQDCEYGIMTHWMECHHARTHRHLHTRHERAVPDLEYLNPEDGLARLQAFFDNRDRLARLQAFNENRDR